MTDKNPKEQRNDLVYELYERHKKRRIFSKDEISILQRWIKDWYGEGHYNNSESTFVSLANEINALDTNKITVKNRKSENCLEAKYLLNLVYPENEESRFWNSNQNGEPAKNMLTRCTNALVRYFFPEYERFFKVPIIPTIPVAPTPNLTNNIEALNNELVQSENKFEEVILSNPPDSLELNDSNAFVNGKFETEILEIESIKNEKKTEEVPLTCLPNNLEYNSQNAFVTERIDTDKLEIEPIKNETKLEVVPCTNLPFNLEIITCETFSNEIFTEQSKINDYTLDYYLKYNNNYTSLKRIVANNIHIKPKNTFKVRFDEEFASLSFDEIAKKATLGGRPILFKILASGGVGKSTLLWNLICDNCTKYSTYFLKRVDPDCVFFLIKNLTKSNNPILLYIDDLVTHEENREALVKFGEAVAELTSLVPVVLIVSERVYRYEKFSRIKLFESNFTDLYFPYSNAFIKKDYFEKIYQSLVFDPNDSLSDFKSYCFQIFNSSKLEGLIDSTINLIIQIGENFPEVKKYSFDWDDWDDSCPKELSELYKVVAFFYQFGVGVPVDYVKEYFVGVRDVVGKLSSMLSSSNNTPIVFYKMNSGKFGLCLRHEKMGEWFFKIKKRELGFDLGTDFFNEFLKNVNSESSAYLFRNIVRNNPEFSKSPYQNLVHNEQILNIIDSYLLSRDESRYEECDFKMLMEKHFILSNLGQDVESIIPLETILKHAPTDIHARTRLANCIKNIDPFRAETLFKEVIEHKWNNLHATFGLYLLYYEFPVLKQFEIYEQTILRRAKSSLFLTNKLIEHIDQNFDKLKNSTIIILNELYDSYKFLGVDIAKLFISKKAYPATRIIFDKIYNSLSFLSYNSRNYFVRLLIKYYQVQNADDKRYLIIAEEILNFNYKENNTNQETISLFAKLLTINRIPTNYKKAEKYIDKMWELNKSFKTFISISRFYRDYAKYIIEREKKDSPAAIIVLLKGIKFIQSRLENMIKGKLACELELAIFYNEIIQAYYDHSHQLNDPTKKYSIIIFNLEVECEALLKRCFSAIYTKLPKSGTDQYSNFIAAEEDIRNLAKACNVSYYYYSNKVKRLIPSNPTSKKQLYLKTKKAFEVSLLYDVDNPMLLNNYIDLKIKLGDSDLSETIDNMNIDRFTIKQRALLCRKLLLNNQEEIGIRLLKKFGPMNSSDLAVKNDLAYCYFKAKEWGSVVRIFSDTENLNRYSIKIIKLIAMEMPFNTEERAKSKILFLEIVLNRTNEDVEILKLNICKTLFVSVGRSHAFDFYCTNRIYLDVFPRNLSNPELGFNYLCKDWVPELVDDIKRKIGIIETMVYQQNRFDDCLMKISDELNRLFELKINYSNISHTHHSDENELHENIRTIIRKAINMLCRIHGENGQISKKAFQIIEKFIGFKNHLFNKKVLGNFVFPEKLDFQGHEVFSKNINLKTSTKKVIEYFSYERIHNNDSFIIRIIGRYYFKNLNFERAYEFFQLGLKYATGNEQRCYSYSNLADLIMTKIERQGKRSFNSLDELKFMLTKTEEYLKRSLKLFPEYHYYTPLQERYFALIEKYK